MLHNMNLRARQDVLFVVDGQTGENLTGIQLFSQGRRRSCDSKMDLVANGSYAWRRRVINFTFLRTLDFKSLNLCIETLLTLLFRKGWNLSKMHSRGPAFYFLSDCDFANCWRADLWRRMLRYRYTHRTSA